MRFNLKNLGLAAAVATLSLSTVACHSQYPGSAGYMPTTTTAQSASQPDGLDPMSKKDDIRSGCGHHENIVIAGIVNCRFREKGYTGKFTIDNHESGIVSVSPSSGTRDTTFTIVGLVSGAGFFSVKDSEGNKFKVRVTVAL